MSAHRATPLPCALPGSPLDAAKAGIDACVHCGFCLQACPTYLALEDENDSPRGRILLMRGLVEGTLAPTDDAVRTHIDRCLGCRACETACPSGVPYGHLLEATRATLAEYDRQPFVARMVLGVFRREWLLRPVLAGARVLRATGIPSLLARLPGRLGFAMAMLASTRREAALDGNRHTATRDGARPVGSAVGGDPAELHGLGSAAVLLGCVMEGLFAETNRATERVLRRNGYSLRDTPGQQCCGALHAHAGDMEGARALARANVRAFDAAGTDVIAVNSAGCGAMMKEYAHLLADDPPFAEAAARVSARVRDISELLVAAGPARGGSLPLTVTYDAPCHLMHAQRIVTPPLSVLGAIDGLTLVPLEDADQCCGAAGIYSLVEPETSAAVLAPKLERIERTGARYVVTGNPGCLMQIGAGLRRAGVNARAVHPVDLLDSSYGVGARGQKS